MTIGNIDYNNLKHIIHYYHANAAILFYLERLNNRSIKQNALLLFLQ